MTATKTAYLTTTLTSLANRSPTSSNKTASNPSRSWHGTKTPNDRGQKWSPLPFFPLTARRWKTSGHPWSGEEANAVVQLSLLVVVLLLVVLVSRRRRRAETPTNVWDEVSDALTSDLFTDREDRLRQKRPEGPPPDYLFQQSLQNAPASAKQPQSGPPLPPSGYLRGGRWSSGSIMDNNGLTLKPDAAH